MQNVDMCVEFKDLTKSQALALKLFFNDWVININRGHSSFIAFMVDGDGNFRPKIRVSTNTMLPEISNDIIMVAHKSIDHTKRVDCLVDFDGIAWLLDKKDIKNG